jgi:hypothetical protein
MKRTILTGIGLASLLALPCWVLRNSNPTLPMREASAALRVGVDSRSRVIGGRDVGEVLINGKPVFRIRTGAGGMTAPQRADAVAARLSEMVDSGRLSADDIRLDYMNGQRVLTANGDLLITADEYHAEANHTTPTRLASMWRGNIVTALGGTLASNPGGRPGGFGGASGTVGALEDVGPALRTKYVPILSAGTGVRLGMAQVTGPERNVDTVKGVAEIEADWKGQARARLYVPISDLNVTRGIHRVPRVGVSGLADVRLKF